MSAEWDNREVFLRQLALNRSELNGPYPDHWQAWIDLLRRAPRSHCPIKLLDVGCGCGARSELCQRHFIDVEYYGCDSSREAIHIADWNFQSSNFYRFDYRHLPGAARAAFDVLSFCALFDVLHDGDSSVTQVLSWGHPCLLFSRMRLTDRPSYVEQHFVYEQINTWRFFHNRTALLETFEAFDYAVDEISHGDTCNFLLRKR